MAGEILAVLDTNVVLRVLLTTRPVGVAAAIDQQWREGAFRLVTSEPTLEELEETLLEPAIARRHGLSAGEVAAYVQAMRQAAIVTPGTTNLDVPGLATRDPDDIQFLVAAVEGGAAFVVSQDRDLLDLGEFAGIAIVDPLEFLQQLRAARPPAT